MFPKSVFFSIFLTANIGTTDFAVTAEPTVTYESIFFDYFQSGWENFSNGGTDTAIRQDDGYAYLGTYSLRIRDGTIPEQATSQSNDFDVNSYEAVQVAFRFKGRGMDANEYFTLKSSVDAGSTWTIESYFFRNSTEFASNNVWYWPHVTIPTDEIQTMRIAFQCHANKKWDRVYIDAVSIMGLTYESESPTGYPSGAPSGTPSESPTALPTSSEEPTRSCIPFSEYDCVVYEDFTDNCCPGTGCIQVQFDPNPVNIGKFQCMP